MFFITYLEKVYFYLYFFFTENAGHRYYGPHFYCCHDIRLQAE
jgi:hypothetical protein